MESSLKEPRDHHNVVVSGGWLIAQPSSKLQQEKKQHDLVVIGDRSGSMAGSRIGKLGAFVQAVGALDTLDARRVVGFFNSISETLPVNTVPTRLSAMGGTSFVAAFQVLINALKALGVEASIPGVDRHLAVVIVSDGESTPDDYAAAKAVLLQEREVLLPLARYASIAILLVGIGASSGVVDMFKDVMRPLREATDSNIIRASFDFMDVSDATPAETFVSDMMSAVQALQTVASVEVRLGDKTIPLQPIDVNGRVVYMAPVVEGCVVNTVPIESLPTTEFSARGQVLLRLMVARLRISTLVRECLPTTAAETAVFKGELAAVAGALPSVVETETETETKTETETGTSCPPHIPVPDPDPELDPDSLAARIQALRRQNALTLFQASTARQAAAGLDTDSSSPLPGLFQGKACAKASTALLTSINAMLRKLDNVSHVMTKAEVLQLLTMTGRQNRNEQRAASVKVSGHSDAVLARIGAHFHVERYEAPEASLAATWASRFMPKVLGLIFGYPCAVYGCRVQVHSDLPDCVQFQVVDALLQPVDTPYAVSQAGQYPTMIAGMEPMPAVSPVYGDPLTTLALLGSMVSINIKHGLADKLNATQILRAYPSFTSALFAAVPGSEAVLDAAVSAFFALAEICGLDSASPAVRAAVPEEVRWVKLSLHLRRCSHDGVLLPAPQAEYVLVPWSQLYAKFAELCRLTPDAFTTNTMHHSMMQLLWVMGKLGLVTSGSGLGSGSGSGSGSHSVSKSLLGPLTLNTDVAAIGYAAALQAAREYCVTASTAKTSTQILKNLTAEMFLMEDVLGAVGSVTFDEGARITMNSIASASSVACSVLERLPGSLPAQLEALEAAMDKPLVGYTAVLHQLVLEPILAGMQRALDTVSVRMGTPKLDPNWASPRWCREVLFRALAGADKAEFLAQISREGSPYVSAPRSVLATFIPKLDADIKDRSITKSGLGVGSGSGSGSGSGFHSLKNKYSCVMGLVKGFRFRDGLGSGMGSFPFPGEFLCGPDDALQCRMSPEVMMEFRQALAQIATTVYSSGGFVEKAKRFLDDVADSEVVEMISFVLLHGGRVLRTRNRSTIYKDARYVNRALFFGLGTPEDIASAMFAAIHAVGEGALHARTPSYVEFDYPCGGHQSQGAVYWDSDLEEPMIRAVSDVVAAPRSLICSGGPELEAVIAWQLPKWFSLWDGVARLSLFARDAVGPFRDSFTRTPRGFPPLRLSIYDA